MLHRDRRALRKIEEDLTATNPQLAETLGNAKTAVHTRTWKALLFLSGFAVAGLLAWTHNTSKAKGNGRNPDHPEGLENFSGETL